MFSHLMKRVLPVDRGDRSADEESKSEREKGGGRGCIIKKHLQTNSGCWKSVIARLQSVPGWNHT